MLELHELDARKVLDRLAEQTLFADFHKARIFMREVEFCVHVLMQGKRSPSPGKLLSIQGWELPKTVTQLRGFLGLTNYYSSYVPITQNWQPHSWLIYKSVVKIEKRFH